MRLESKGSDPTEEKRGNMHRFVFLVTALFFCGCAAVNRPMPTASDKQYDKALVIVNSGLFSYTRQAEKEIVYGLDARKIGAIEANSVMSLIKKYTKQEIQDICGKNGVDSIIYVAVTAAGEKSVQIPATYGGFANNNFAFAQGVGSYSVDMPYADIKIQLIDASDSHTVWETTGRVDGKDEYKFGDGLSDLIAKELEASKLFRPQWEDIFLFRRQIIYSK